MTDIPDPTVEAVAEAIWREDPHPLPDKWPSDNPEPFYRMARAAIAAHLASQPPKSSLRPRRGRGKNRPGAPPEDPIDLPEEQR